MKRKGVFRYYVYTADGTEIIALYHLYEAKLWAYNGNYIVRKNLLDGTTKIIKK